MSSDFAQMPHLGSSTLGGTDMDHQEIQQRLFERQNDYLLREFGVERALCAPRTPAPRVGPIGGHRSPQPSTRSPSPGSKSFANHLVGQDDVRLASCPENPRRTAYGQGETHQILERTPADPTPASFVRNSAMEIPSRGCEDSLPASVLAPQCSANSHPLFDQPLSRADLSNTQQRGTSFRGTVAHPVPSSQLRKRLCGEPNSSEPQGCNKDAHGTPFSSLSRESEIGPCSPKASQRLSMPHDLPCPEGKGTMQMPDHSIRTTAPAYSGDRDHWWDHSMRFTSAQASLRSAHAPLTSPAETPGTLDRLQSLEQAMGRLTAAVSLIAQAMTQFIDTEKGSNAAMFMDALGDRTNDNAPKAFGTAADRLNDLDERMARLRSELFDLTLAQESSCKGPHKEPQRTCVSPDGRRSARNSRSATPNNLCPTTLDLARPLMPALVRPVPQSLSWSQSHPPSQVAGHDVRIRPPRPLSNPRQMRGVARVLSPPLKMADRQRALINNSACVQQRNGFGPYRPSNSGEISSPLQDITAVPIKWEQFPLHPSLLYAVSKYGFGPPNRMQQRALPFLLQSFDVVAQAAPTQERIATYVVPALHCVLEGIQRSTATTSAHRSLNEASVVIVTTTLDQATQVQRMCLGLGSHLGVRVFLCAGPTAAMADDSGNLTRETPHIVVGTPNNLHDLFDHLAVTSAQDTRPRLVILDEVDQMIARNLHKRVAHLIASLGQPTGLSEGMQLRQTAIFSNTVPQDVINFAQSVQMRESVRILVRRDGTTVTQHPAPV